MHKGKPLCLYWTVRMSCPKCTRQCGVRTAYIFSDLSSPLLSHLFKKHPLFEAGDGKRERLKQSASKLACQKALNQYPSSLPTQPCSPFTPPAPYQTLPFPHSSGCFPSSASIFYCTPAHSPPCSPARLSFLSLTLNLIPSLPPNPCFLPQLTDREKGQSL